MPSKSRKKIKGQARKAKAKAAATAVNNNELTFFTTPNNSICNHGDCTDDNTDVCGHFIKTFFTFLLSPDTGLKSNEPMMKTVQAALSTTYNKFPEAVNKEDYRHIVKRNIICNGTSYLLGTNPGSPASNSTMSLTCAIALMHIDSYSPSFPVASGFLDQRDPKQMMRNIDILNGCQRSLVKFFVNQIPCKCLDKLYFQIRSITPKMGKCWGCRQMKERSTLFVCTGCERTPYCSKACQIAHAPNHKYACKVWQSGRCTYDC